MLRDSLVDWNIEINRSQPRWILLILFNQAVLPLAIDFTSADGQPPLKR